MNVPAMKFIYTPEYKRLRPMKRVGGPVMGPTEPSRVAIEIVRECLLQDDAPKIMEVIQTGTYLGRPVWSDPVQLTLENYQLPYSEIAGVSLETIMQEPAKVEETAPVVEPEVPTEEPVAPVEEPAAEEVATDTPSVEEVKVEEPAVEEAVAEPEVPAEEPVAPVEEPEKKEAPKSGKSGRK